MRAARTLVNRIAQFLVMPAMAAAAADQNPTVILRDDDALIEAQAPASTDVIDWTTSDVDHLSQRWYWYRVGADGSQPNSDTLELQSRVLTDTDLDGDGDTLFVSYRDSDRAFRTSTRYVLNGGLAGFGVSILDELITVENTLDQPLIFHFIGFHDRPLADTALDTSVNLVNGIQTVRTDGALTLHVTAITPAPNALEPDPETTILNELADVAHDSLAAIVGQPEPHDPNWAFQWTVAMAPRGAFQIRMVTRIATGAAYCGDGVVAIDEQCDDGNLDDGDGCAADCTLERQCRLLSLALPVAHGGQYDAHSHPHDDTNTDWAYDSTAHSNGDGQSDTEFADDPHETDHGEPHDHAGHQLLRIAFDASDDCSHLSATIDTACDTIPVDNGQLVDVLCLDPNEQNTHECSFEFHQPNAYNHPPTLEIRSTTARLTVTATNDAGLTTSRTEDLCAKLGDTNDSEDEIDCACRGKLATLTLQYKGHRTAIIEVQQNKGHEIVFEGLVRPGQRFSFAGTERGTLGSKIVLFNDTNTEPPTVIPTKCSNKIGIGSVFGDFEVVDGADKYGGTLCPSD